MKTATPDQNALTSALALRQQAVARWRQLAERAATRDPGLAPALARVSASEQQHAERLARELPMLDGEEFVRIVGATRPEGAAAGREARRPARAGGGRGDGNAVGGDGEASLGACARALEDALAHERRLRSAFEQLAARAGDDQIRVRALALALAETRHLRVLEEALGSLRCKL
ncbi:hypothetical protein M6I34_17485 [Burkholderiaceae bacterium FT117]|uniref:hypothetical protein n=1 Tax=Zeimonas sediminis TaxID=2944268 RepID=UPI002343195D|nr:hypothetical protein [Zeimonas sediminis]MCM5572311.1 hypothetical protein [Zeimonas sediminis]